MDRKRIDKVILDAAAETSDELLSAINDTGQDTVLFGRGAILDSLALVALIAAVESTLALSTGRDILLVSEAAMSRTHSPFRTVGLFTDYVHDLVNEEGA